MSKTVGRLIVFWSLILALEVVMSGSASAADRADSCEQLWAEVTSRQGTSSKGDVEALLAKWESLGEKCKGTGIYEARLASLYLTLGNSKKAGELLRGQQVPRRYEALAMTIKLRAELTEMSSGKEIDRKQLKAIEIEAANVVSRDPDYIPLLLMLGAVRVKLQEYGDAIEPLETARRHPEGNRWPANRNLAIAYTYSGKYPAALAAADRAYAGNKGITSDEEFMYALAIAYAASDRTDEAKDTLELILNKKPQLSQDQRFQQTVLRARELSGGKLK